MASRVRLCFLASASSSSASSKVACIPRTAWNHRGCEDDTNSSCQDTLMAIIPCIPGPAWGDR